MPVEVFVMCKVPLIEIVGTSSLRFSVQDVVSCCGSAEAQARATKKRIVMRLRKGIVEDSLQK